MQETILEVDLDHVPLEEGVYDAIVGQDFQNIDYIQRTTNAVITVEGHGSPQLDEETGRPSVKPLKIIIQHIDEEQLAFSTAIVKTLVENVREKYKDFKKPELVYCDVCNMSVLIQLYDQHCMGVLHKKRVQVLLRAKAEAERPKEADLPPWLAAMKPEKPAAKSSCYDDAPWKQRREASPPPKPEAIVPFVDEPDSPEHYDVRKLVGQGRSHDLPAPRRLPPTDYESTHFSETYSSSHGSDFMPKRRSPSPRLHRRHSRSPPSYKARSRSPYQSPRYSPPSEPRYEHDYRVQSSKYDIKPAQYERSDSPPARRMQPVDSLKSSSPRRPSPSRSLSPSRYSRSTYRESSPHQYSEHSSSSHRERSPEHLSTSRREPSPISHLKTSHREPSPRYHSESSYRERSPGYHSSSSHRERSPVTGSSGYPSSTHRDRSPEHRERSPGQYSGSSHSERSSKYPSTSHREISPGGHSKSSNHEYSPDRYRRSKSSPEKRKSGSSSRKSPSPKRYKSSHSSRQSHSHSHSPDRRSESLRKRSRSRSHSPGRKYKSSYKRSGSPSSQKSDSRSRRDSRSPPTKRRDYDSSKYRSDSSKKYSRSPPRKRSRSPKRETSKKHSSPSSVHRKSSSGKSGQPTGVSSIDDFEDDSSPPSHSRSGAKKSDRKSKPAASKESTMFVSRKNPVSQKNYRVSKKLSLKSWPPSVYIMEKLKSIFADHMSNYNREKLLAEVSGEISIVDPGALTSRPNFCRMMTSTYI